MLTTQIEALLFASDQPLSLARIAEVLEGVPRAEIETALEMLEQAYASPDRAFQLTRAAGGWQLVTKPELASVVRRLFVGKRRVRLTKAALESLAIIAYKQPTTRPEIDAIRGVASGGVLETLLERNLVRIAGRSEGIGRPLLYATTPEFLQYLGLDNLRDLPSLEELEAMLVEREAAARAAEDEELQALAAARLDAGAEAGEAGTEAVGAEDGLGAPAGERVDAGGGAALLEPGAAPGAPSSAAARIEAKLREHALPTLDELDAELEERGSHVQRLSARVAAERARHTAETADPAAAPAPEPQASAALDAFPTEPGAGTRLESDAETAVRPVAPGGGEDPLAEADVRSEPAGPCD